METRKITKKLIETMNKKQLANNYVNGYVHVTRFNTKRNN